ncbi:hypothetical protein BSKO_04097 [Bryopsis sp. KO-2023]|nr:hypothetical protein BSKO_04097 [Bryopsis sp. KO-2023]
MSENGEVTFDAKVAELEKGWQKAIRSSEMSLTLSERLRVLLNDVADAAECKRKEILLKNLEGWIVEERNNTPVQKRRRNPRWSRAIEGDGGRGSEMTSSGLRDVETESDDFELIPTALQRVQFLSLKAFGSSEMGLSFKGGDLDISLEGSVGSERLGHWRMCGRQGSKFEKDLLREVHRVLRKKHFGKSELVLGTRIPVSKFTEKHTGIECDLSVGNSLGVFKSRLLGKVIELDPRVKELIFSVKKWAKANCINHSPSGTFNSYCLTLAVICFCQSRSPRILPPFKELFPGLREALKSRKPVLSLLQVYEGTFKKWVAANKASSSSNKEPLFNLFINFLVVFRLFAFNSAKGARSTGKILAGSAWDGGFCPLAWNKRSFIFVDDPFEPFANNTARTLNGRGWDLFEEILRRSNSAILTFSKGRGDSSKKFWPLWRELFNASHKDDPAPSRSPPRNKKNEGRNRPANEAPHNSRSVVLVNRLANGEMSSQVTRALAPGPSRAVDDPPRPGPARGPARGPAPATSSGENGNQTENGLETATPSPQPPARGPRKRSKMNASHIAAREALSNKVDKPKAAYSKPDDAGNTSLHHAASSGSLRNLQDLLSEEGNPNVRNKKGETPLMLAAAKGHLSCVQVLLDRGARKEMCDNWGCNARMMIGIHLSVLYGKDYDVLVKTNIGPKSDKALQEARRLALKWVNIKPRKDLMARARKSRSSKTSGSTPWDLKDALRRVEHRAKLEKLLGE